MKINSIKIESLFDIFQYDISFKQKENVLIITGPNGFGKTMVLNIIFSLFNRQFLFFQKLVFKEITLCLDENIKIVISKNEENKEDKKNKTSFSFFEHDIKSGKYKEIDKFDYSNKLESDLERNIQKYLPVHRVAPDKWMDMRTDRLLTMDDLLNEYADQLPAEISKNILRIKSDKVNEILDSIQVHLIKEQRLFKKAHNVERNYREEKEQTIMIETIQTYAKELKQLISEFSQKSFSQTQELDSSYPNRLRSETQIFTEDEYEIRYNSLKSKQKKLTEFGLYESKQEFLTYSQEDAKALSVYLKDFELKLGVFDALLEKLELFTNILNERRFTFKSINVNRLKGFFFKTIKGKELDLSQLSSGEQHEVVLLYELIFNVKPNILVLIDEPEISLHITWQKEFLNDLLKIIKIQNIQVLIATHSPSIINDRWDLVYNLETDNT
jgi:predicted ATP-binding protein involved in virulence